MERELPKWRQLLALEIDRTNVTETAKRLGYSRSSISLAKDGNYTAGTTKLEQRVLDVLGGPEPTFYCPAQAKSITETECLAFAAKPVSTTNPRALRQWQICQSCEHREERNDVK